MIPLQYVEAGCAFEREESASSSKTRAIGYGHVDLVAALEAERTGRFYPLMAQAERIGEEMEYIARVCIRIHMITRGSYSPGIEIAGVVLSAYARNPAGYFHSLALGQSDPNRINEKWRIYEAAWSIFEKVIQQTDPKILKQIEEGVEESMKLSREYRVRNILARLQVLENFEREEKRREEYAEQIYILLVAVLERVEDNYANADREKQEIIEEQEHELCKQFGLADLLPECLDRWLKGEERKLQAYRVARFQEVMEKARVKMEQALSEDDGLDRK